MSELAKRTVHVQKLMKTNNHYCKCPTVHGGNMSAIGSFALKDNNPSDPCWPCTAAKHVGEAHEERYQQSFTVLYNC